MNRNNSEDTRDIQAVDSMNQALKHLATVPTLSCCVMIESQRKNDQYHNYQRISANSSAIPGHANKSEL